MDGRIIRLHHPTLQVNIRGITRLGKNGHWARGGRRVPAQECDGLAFLEKRRDEIQRDAKHALDLYYGAVRDGDVDDILMELQISYSELSRKEHYLDHGIIIIEGIGDEGAWASHVMMTPDQLMAHTDYLWTNAHYREWRARLIDIHTRNQPDGNMNTDDTPGTTRAVPYGDFQLVELPEPVAGSTSPQAASAHASPAAASPTVSAHSGTAASPDVPAPSDNASPRATPPPSDDTTDSAAPAHADAGAPPAAGNECEAPVVAAHPRLPLLGFVIPLFQSTPENTLSTLSPKLSAVRLKLRFAGHPRRGTDMTYATVGWTNPLTVFRVQKDLIGWLVHFGSMKSTVPTQTRDG